MRWTAVYPVSLTVLLFCGVPTRAVGQNEASHSVTNQSVAVAYVNAVGVQQRIVVRFIITNNRRERVYFLDARAEDSQCGILFPSGLRLTHPYPLSGIEFCNSTISTCIANPGEMELSKFSYLEPGASMNVSFQYPTQAASESETIDVTMALIARFAKPGDESRAGQPQALKFPFQDIEISH